MTNWRGSGGGWDVDAPVWDSNFDYTFDGKKYAYPDVTITEQRQQPTETTTGRACIWHYVPSTDAGGWQALRFGSSYYDEGMSCDPELDREKRIMCFQAAELLYLHASALGNPLGDLNLGYVYSYDRCEGRYWEKVMTWETEEDLHRPYPCDEKAYEHYRRAAEAGIAEACYKLGDMLRDGRGCDQDAAEAFTWFSRAYKLGKSEVPVIWGSAALRLGCACEEGEGCAQSFDEACAWYERATTGLGIAVRSGEDWYRGALRRAERGLTRVRQELDGRY